MAGCAVPFGHPHVLAMLSYCSCEESGNRFLMSRSPSMLSDASGGVRFLKFNWRLPVDRSPTFSRFMSDSSSPSNCSQTRPTLPDPWAPGRRITLDGPLEPAANETLFGSMTGFLAIIGGFILFQVIVSPVILVGILAFVEGPGAMSILTNQERLLSGYAQELLLTNALAQWVSFGALTLLLARLHAQKIAAFLRVRTPAPGTLGLSLAGMVALLPVAQWLAQINQQLPLPEFFRVLDEQSMKLVEQALASDFSLVFGLLVMAVTPAICEELIFRGYAQRQFERAMPPLMAILASGLLFGFYHLRLTQFLPLAAIGIYLAYLTWRTGSLWPAVIAHFANNAMIVVGSRYMGGEDDVSATVAQDVTIPWYAIVLGIVGFAGVIYAFETYIHPPDGDEDDLSLSA